MKLLATEDLRIDTLHVVEATVLELGSSSPRPHSKHSILTEQQEKFIRDRFSTKLDDPQTGRSIRSWRTDGA